MTSSQRGSPATRSQASRSVAARAHGRPSARPIGGSALSGRRPAGRRGTARLPLQLEGLDRLDLDGIAGERDRLGRPESRRAPPPAGAGRDVHGVTGREPLLRARDDLAGGHADPPLDPELGNRLASRPRPACAQCVVLMHAGTPNTAITASPMNFSTEPPCARRSPSSARSTAPADPAALPDPSTPPTPSSRPRRRTAPSRPCVARPTERREHHMLRRTWRRRCSRGRSWCRSARGEFSAVSEHVGSSVWRPPSNSSARSARCARYRTEGLGAKERGVGPGSGSSLPPTLAQHAPARIGMKRRWGIRVLLPHASLHSPTSRPRAGRGCRAPFTRGVRGQDSGGEFRRGDPPQVPVGHRCRRVPELGADRR